MPKSKSLKCAFYGIMPEFKQYLRSRLRGHKATISSDPLDINKLDANTQVLGVFVDSEVDKKVINKLKKLKLIVALSTGYDHIDIKAAKAKKIPVCFVPSYGENTVAEHALALILALSRKLFPSVKRVKEGVFDYHGLRGFDLKGRTIGVVGTGRIGCHLIRMLQGFEMTILAHDPFPKKDFAKECKFQYVSLPQLLKKSDIVSLHVPLLPTTHHMINKSKIKQMKKGSYLVNTARGGLVDSEALVWALESGHLSGAGLDVLDQEEFVQDPSHLFYCKEKKKAKEICLMNNILIDHPNTIVTPHNAFNSAEAVHRIIDTTVENIKAFVAGNIQNDVTKPKAKKK